MDTEIKNTSEEADMTDCDEEKVVTMMDVLQEQEEFEEDANAVLGASDDKNCTYSMGYIKRQAIYACLTCCSEAKNDPAKRAGLCLACSLTCHENHELIELYTKRNFKCDCGNPKFNSHPCQFTPNKTDLNEDNTYNQNFSGLYCICQRPYPDLEATSEDEMIQCIICEDWLHASHLDATVPDNEQYSEMICKGCMEKNDFLHDYSNLAVNAQTEINVHSISNGIDSENTILNGDIKLNVINKDSIQDESLDVEMTEKNDKIKDSVSTTVENMSDKECSIDPKESIDTSMENSDLHTASISKESSGKNAEENSETEINQNYSSANDNSTIKEPLDVQEQQHLNNEAKLHENETTLTENELPKTDSQDETPISENATESENVEKSAEQLEEERLLAEPDDEIKKSTLETKDNDTDKSTLPETTENEPTVSDADKLNLTNPSVTETESINNNQGNSNTGDSSLDENNEYSIQIESNSVASISEETVTNNENKKMLVNEKGIEKRKLSTEENNDPNVKKAKLGETNDEPCVRLKNVPRVYRGATFWPSTFRQQLCTCRECTTMYKDLSVLFLIDPEDTVNAYENLGKQKSSGKPASQYEKGLQALSSLDRIQQINALTEYNKMRDKLLEFLKSFKDRKEVVKEDDIRAFFAGMKPKREPDGIYFCR